MRNRASGTRVLGRAARAAFLLGALAASRPGPAAAQGHTYFCQVSQPMVARDDRRIEIQTVTYALKLESPVPGVEIKYTCFPGPSVVRRGNASDTVNTSDIANLNAANLLGLSLKVEARPPGTWSIEKDTSRALVKETRFYVGQLQVDLDVSPLLKQRSHASDPKANRQELAQFDALVAATVECILENARRSLPPIRKIQLNVLGWDRYRHMTDVYQVKPPPERKQFNY